jgi:hypothetical protein
MLLCLDQPFASWWGNGVGGGLNLLKGQKLTDLPAGLHNGKQVWV